MIVGDSLLGIKYFIDSHAPQGYVETRMSSTWLGNRLFENPYALPLGFRCDPNTLDEIEFTGDPFRYQNDFLSSLCGTDSQYLIPIKPTLTLIDDMTMTWTFEVPDNMLIYGYVDPDNNHTLKLFEGKEYLFTFGLFAQGMFPILSSDEEGLHSITVKGDIPESYENIHCFVAYLDLPRFESAIKQLKTHSIKLEVLDDGYVYGNYSAEKDELLFITIPYDRGWTIKINNSVVTPKIAQNTFIVLEVSQGNNVIEMSYMSPGFIPGVIASSVSIILAVLFMVLISQRRPAHIKDRKPERG